MITKSKTQSVPLDRDFEHMLISAERYALGRRTYIVSTTVDYIVSLMPRLSDWCLGVLLKDIKTEEEFSSRLPKGTDHFGDQCDYENWMDLKSELLLEIEKREASKEQT